MKPSIVPASCSVALAVMAAAVLSHWWSVRGFVGAVHANSMILAGAPAVPPPAVAPVPLPAPAPVAVPAAKPASPRPTSLASSPRLPDSQQEFFASLLDEMRQLRRENSTLRNQMAETNRDLVNLEFRVDTHSSQFRPLRVAEEIDEPAEDLTEPPVFDDGPGVLPPRPEIVGLPEPE